MSALGEPRKCYNCYTYEGLCGAADPTKLAKMTVARATGAAGQARRRNAPPVSRRSEDRRW